MPNTPKQHNTKLESVLYSAFLRKYAGKTEKEIAGITGLTITSVSGIKLKRSRLSFGRLAQTVKIFPELEEVIIQFLRGDYRVDNKTIEELSKHEKLELVIRVLSTL